MAQKDFYASAPTVVLPPVQSFSPFTSSNNLNTTNGDNMAMDYFDATPSESSCTITPSAGALAGRKRSRHDIYATPDDEHEGRGFFNGAESSDQPSRLRLDPSDDFDMDIDSSTASHFKNGSEMNATTSSTNVSSYSERPVMTSRKSQRRETVSDQDDNMAQLVLPPQMRESTKEPLIDEVTRILGISWTRMDNREASLINQAAYSKWIEHHYSALTEVTVWFENSALPGYLVCAKNNSSGQQAYYIFSHDLKEARLVTTDPDQLVPRLKLLPALHLAAPGGVLEADAAKAKSSSHVADTDSDLAESDSFTTDEYVQPVGLCAAHSMEMD